MTDEANDAHSVREETSEPQVREPSRADAALAGGAYGMLVLLGIFVGVYGAFFFSLSVGIVPLGALVAVVVNFVMCRAAGWLMGTRLAALLPAVGWLGAVVALSSKRGEGDVVITGTTPGYILLFGGTAAAVAAVTMSHLNHVKAKYGPLP